MRVCHFGRTATDRAVCACRLTRDATLAELTSLEQLLAVMMAKGVVSDEVIAKLWQVYSTSAHRLCALRSS